MTMRAPITGARPRRDKATWLTYVQISLWAWFMYAYGATVALLSDEQGTTRSVAGLHGLLFAASGIISGLLTAKFVARYGRGRVIRFASLGLVVGIAIYIWPSAPVYVTLAGAFFAGLTGTFMLITANAFLLTYQGKAGPASLTEANALASVSGLIAPVAIGIGAATLFGWRTGILVSIIGLVLVEVFRGNRTAKFGAPRDETLSAHRTAHLPRRIYWSMGLVVCFLGIEFSMVFWSADLLRERAAFGPAAAAASLAAVTGGMAVGRLGGSRLAEHWSGDRVLKVSIVVALAGFALAWFTTNGLVMLVGLAITGLGLGVHWPLGVSRAVHASGGMADRASALASVFGSASIALAPFILGALSDQIGFHQAFLLVPAMLIVALVILVLRPDPTPAP